MTGRTEERLRDATRALGRSIGPRDIPELKLSGYGQGVAAGHRPWRAGGHWTGARWLVPVAVGAVVLALVISLAVIGRTLPRPRPTSPAESVHGVPAYLIIARDGHGYVQATATGQVVARIPPPVRGFLIDGVAVQPGERAFYLVGEVPFGLPVVKIEFFRFTLDSRGRPGRPQRLGAPVMKRRPDGLSGPMVIPLAISPDGSELAYAWPDQTLAGDPPYHQTTVTVQDVATSTRRTWIWPPTPGTEIMNLSFAGVNRLGFVAFIADAAVSGGTVVHRHDSQVRVVMILNLAAPGSSLVADSRLVTYGSQPSSADIRGPWTLPLYGLIGQGGHSAYLVLGSEGKGFRLVRMLVSTGKVTSVLVRTGLSYPFDIDGDHMLIFLRPRHLNDLGSRIICANLADVNLSTGGISRLPTPPSCHQISNSVPFEVAW